MQTPETRTIHQCTYTPIRTQDGQTVPKQPFLKQALLLTSFHDQQVGRLVLQRMADWQQDATHQRFPHFEELASAVASAWSGATAASVGALRELDNDELVRFAREALEAERELLDQAQRDVKSSIDTLIKRAQSDNQLLRELEAMREAILSDTRDLVASSLAERSTHVKKAEVSEAGRMASNSTAPAFQPRSIDTVEAALAAPPTVAVADLRAQLVNDAPLSAAFLDALRMFNVSSGDSSPPMIGSIVNIAGLIIDQKTQTLESLIKNIRVEPLGYLHLERLQFTPLGYERGDLVYSLPMLPGETVRLTHREWSHTDTEYTKLIESEIETATDEQVSEKSELTQSSNIQQQHSSAFNASVSAGYSGGGFSISTSVGYNCNDSESTSRQFAAKHAQEITKKATSRVKKDAKMTFKVSTAYELEDQSYREFKNERDKPVRYDFHRLVKKWRIDLYRYDARLTYDIVIPEPGSYLLRKHIFVAQLNNELIQPYSFNVSAAAIARGTPGAEGPTDWKVLQRQYGVTLDPPPAETIPVPANSPVTFSKQQQGDGYLEITLPEGYEFLKWTGHDKSYSQTIKGDDNTVWTQDPMGTINALQNENTARLESGLKHGNRYSWRYLYWWDSANKSGYKIDEGTTMTVDVDVIGTLTDKAFSAWQSDCYQRLSDAARVQYEHRQAKLKELRDTIVAELSREDALMLRKLEKEELMKCVLRWLLGPRFELYPSDILALPQVTFKANGDIEYYDPETQSVKSIYWQSGLQYGEMVKFLHQAIEWENVNYVLYPYFWSNPDKARWEFKQGLYHADYVHRSFLRAGAARVVLTIRRGFEREFLSYMEGSLVDLLQSDHPYMTAADELEAMAKTRYPYSEDANTEKQEYLFTWENIPEKPLDDGSRPDTARLLQYLEHDLLIPFDQAALPMPEKSADGLTIVVAAGDVGVALLLDEQNNVVNVKADGSRTYELTVSTAGGVHAVYKEQNWVDTWYEFTPTGALDVKEGETLA